jgi:glucose/arabinose dehydrogenase
MRNLVRLVLSLVGMTSRALRTASVAVTSLIALVLGGSLLPAQAVVVPSPPRQAATPSPHDVRLSLHRMAKGLSQPVFVTAARDGLGRLYVVERSGRIRIFVHGHLRAKPYLDIRGRVNSAGGEEGLLGLAFSPTFVTDHRLWVTYTDGAGALQVSRFKAAATRSKTVKASTEVKLLRVPHPTYTNHNAGMLVFGRGGNLFIGTGDGGGSGDPFRHAQDRTSLSGKVLRIDPNRGCGSKHYCIPRSNPYAGSHTRRRAIYLFGVRNPWRFSIDRANGDLWIADVGQDRYEEVTRVPSGKSGWNLGWSCREGRSVYSAARCSSTRTYHDPTIVYGHGAGASVIGGYVYRGTKFASRLEGLYVFGDYISGRLWVKGTGDRVQVDRIGGGRLTAFGEGDTGELYATTLDGGLYRVVASAR